MSPGPQVQLSYQRPSLCCVTLESKHEDMTCDPDSEGEEQSVNREPPPGDSDSLERREGRAGVEGGC